MIKHNLNFNLPEIDKLEELAGIYDDLLQEGMIYSKEEKDRALFLWRDIGMIIDQIKVKK